MEFLDLSKIDIKPNQDAKLLVGINDDGNVVKVENDTEEKLTNKLEDYATKESVNDAINFLNYSSSSNQLFTEWGKVNGDKGFLPINNVTQSKAGVLTSADYTKLLLSLNGITVYRTSNQFRLHLQQNNGVSPLLYLPSVDSNNMGLLTASSYLSLMNNIGFETIDINSSGNVNGYTYSGAFQIYYNLENNSETGLPNDIPNFGDCYLFVTYGNIAEFVDTSAQFLFTSNGIYTRRIEWDFRFFEGDFTGVEWYKMGENRIEGAPDIKTLNGKFTIYLADYEYSKSPDFYNFINQGFNDYEEVVINIDANNLYQYTFFECYWKMLGEQTIKKYQKCFLQGNGEMGFTPQILQEIVY